MSETVLVLSLLTGLVAGAFFKYLMIPIPAPADISGVVGILGIYAGYRIVGYFDWGFDLVEALGL